MPHPRSCLRQASGCAAGEARFDAARQVLALMDPSPNIARVYGAEATEQSRPYFGMEHLAGRPITEYCYRARLSNRACLDLLTTFCDAVQHAHQKGLIHSDIKPSNVMVKEVDGKPLVKIIDCCIAKATQLPLNEHGQLVGAPEHMAPEQAAQGGVNIDTRADIDSPGELRRLSASRPTGSSPITTISGRSECDEKGRRPLSRSPPPYQLPAWIEFDHGEVRTAGPCRPPKSAKNRVWRGDGRLHWSRPAPSPLREAASSDAGAQKSWKKGAVCPWI